MARGGSGLTRRIISVGFLPEKLRRDVIYVDISAKWGGINVEVVSNEPFGYQYDGESGTRFAERIQFFEYLINLRKETAITLNQYIGNVHQSFMRIDNFLVKLAKKNNAKIHSGRAFKEIRLLHNGLEEMLKKVRPHLRN